MNLPVAIFAAVYVFVVEGIAFLLIGNQKVVPPIGSNALPVGVVVVPLNAVATVEAEGLT